MHLYLLHITKFNKVIILQDVFYDIIIIQQTQTLASPNPEAHILDRMDPPAVRFVLNVSLEGFRAQPLNCAGDIFAWNGEPLVSDVDGESRHRAGLNDRRLLPEECDEQLLCKMVHKCQWTNHKLSCGPLLFLSRRVQGCVWVSYLCTKGFVKMVKSDTLNNVPIRLNNNLNIKILLQYGVLRTSCSITTKIKHSYWRCWIYGYKTYTKTYEESITILNSN